MLLHAHKVHRLAEPETRRIHRRIYISTGKRTAVFGKISQIPATTREMEVENDRRAKVRYLEISIARNNSYYSSRFLRSTSSIMRLDICVLSQRYYKAAPYPMRKQIFRQMDNVKTSTTMFECSTRIFVLTLSYTINCYFTRCYFT